MGREESQLTGKLFQRKEAAKLLRMSLPTLDEHTRSGRIPAYRLGKKVLFKEDELIQSLQQIVTRNSKTYPK
jgi:excisionase family DNA binding protein